MNIPLGDKFQFNNSVVNKQHLRMYNSILQSQNNSKDFDIYTAQKKEDIRFLTLKEQTNIHSAITEEVNYVSITDL